MTTKKLRFKICSNVKVNRMGATDEMKKQNNKLYNNL
jgi:hypothetical protein